ncbi:MAG: hypothetical protein JO089_06360 [Alphaproteobacteria bacterium]|nr:hypothetical protein [Alphaproteobacteria bacterium]
MRISLSFAALAALLSLPLLSSAAFADPPEQAGRLSYVQGNVAWHAEGEGEWSAAGLNYPVAIGQSLWTDADARAEIQLGFAELRMDQTTELEVTRLDDSAAAVQLDQGTLNVHVGAVPPGGMQVVTPYGQVFLLRPGHYHLEASSEQPSGQVSTLEGEAQLQTESQPLIIHAGESAVIGGDPLAVMLAQGNLTPFDEWASARERQEEAGEARRYVSPAIPGYQDLDAYGRWHAEPDYGPVWYPTYIAAGWAPYRYGHWAFIPPWGWTWIDEAPWGFAPFHYGRWIELHGRWGWSPGEPVAHPVYAPALVAFLGSSVTLSFGERPVGWVPLAPHEAFHPYYHASDAYMHRVNTNVTVNQTTITNIVNAPVTQYANYQAATVVPANAFAHGAPVHKAQVSVPPAQLVAVHPAQATALPVPAARPRAASVPPEHTPHHELSAGRAMPVTATAAHEAATFARPAPHPQTPVAAVAHPAPPAPPVSISSSQPAAHEPASPPPVRITRGAATSPPLSERAKHAAVPPYPHAEPPVAAAPPPPVAPAHPLPPQAQAVRPAPAPVPAPSPHAEQQQSHKPALAERPAHRPDPTRQEGEHP